MNPVYLAVKRVASLARYPLSQRLLIALQRRILLDADPAFRTRWGDRARRADARISPRDEMYFGLRQYYAVGLSALDCVEEAMGAAGLHSVTNVLDLPSGHGRVLRFLVERFPAARFTACDLGRDAVEFCAATFGARAVASCPDLDALDLGERFDLIWCGSLVTHLDEARIEALLRCFHRHLDPAGLLVFSTHGDKAAENLQAGKLFHYGLGRQAARNVLRSYLATGLGYSDYAPGRAPAYGVSFTTPGWIRGTLERIGGFREVYFAEKGWAAHHDIFGLVPAADGQVR
jgi:SAM-dependent methyltransferase